MWDEAPQYNGWRAGNVSDCNLGLLGCTAKRGGEMRKSADGRYYSCSENKWVEITDEVYINTYLYRCTIDGEGERVYKDGDLVYGIEKTKTRYACENEQWRDTKAGEEQAGKACTARLQGTIIEMLDSAITCDTLNWRASIVYDYPVDKDWTNPDLTYGVLEDKRDGRVYKTVEINGITLMAENLQYADSIKNPYLKENTWCYDNDTTNCLKGGRYYTWAATMDIDSKWLDASPYGVEGLIESPHQGVCPEGWHVPTNGEWNALFDGVSYEARQALGNPLWKNATNASGFSALPVGYHESEFEKVGFDADFWSASEADEFVAFHLYMASGDYYGSYLSCGSYTNYSIYGKHFGFSIRCFKDSE